MLRSNGILKSVLVVHSLRSVVNHQLHQRLARIDPLQKALLYRFAPEGEMAVVVD